MTVDPSGQCLVERSVEIVEMCTGQSCADPLLINSPDKHGWIFFFTCAILPELRRLLWQQQYLLRGFWRNGIPVIYSVIGQYEEPSPSIEIFFHDLLNGLGLLCITVKPQKAVSPYIFNDAFVHALKDEEIFIARG